MPNGIALALPLVTGAVVLGVLLGGRASAEDGRSAARIEMALGNPARAVSLDESVAGRSGFLMLLDPGASPAADHDAQAARIAWARQLAGAGNVDSAVTVLAQVRLPALIAPASQARTQILLGAANAAIKAGHATLALRRLAEAEAADTLAGSTVRQIAALRATAEVTAAAELVAAGRAPGALVLLDDAAAHGSAAAAAPAYPATILAAAQAEIALLDQQEAVTNLRRLVANFGSTSQALTARSLLVTPQPVSGTLVDSTGHGAPGRVRLSTHFTQLPGGYITSGPFYYANANGYGDFTTGPVPVGDNYVLEYNRGAGWMTLVDPRTDRPADPISVAALTPADLTFIVVP